MGAAGLLAGSTFLRIYTRGPDPLVYDSPQRPVCSRDLGHRHLASRGGRHSKDPPPPPRGVNFLLGGSDPPP
jgi:hypothetical protein